MRKMMKVVLSAPFFCMHDRFMCYFGFVLGCLLMRLFVWASPFGVDEGQDEYEKDGFIVDDVDEEEEEEANNEDSDEERHRKKKKKRRQDNCLIIP